MRPITLELLTTIDGKVDEILEMMRTQLAIETPLPALPSLPHFRLQESFREDPCHPNTFGRGLRHIVSSFQGEYVRLLQYRNCRSDR